MILAFAHPALVVPDLEKARSFYQAMFGFRRHCEEGWRDNPAADRAVGLNGGHCRGYTLAGHNCFLELFEFSAPQQEGPEPAALGPHEPGIRHLSFFVDDCRLEYRRLLELGGLPLGEAPAEDAPVQAVYGRDPFGNIIELCQIPCAEENPVHLPGISCLMNGSTEYV